MIVTFNSFDSNNNVLVDDDDDDDDDHQCGLGIIYNILVRVDDNSR